MDAQACSTVHLVGERFAAFARNDDVETVNRFIGNVRTGLYDEDQTVTRLFAGQGIDASDWETIRTELARRGLLDRFRLPSAPVVVAPALVHKRLPENVMLADARRRGPMRLAARLCLSDMNELVIDHVTGQHLAGMVLVEAARQLIQLTTYEFVLDGVEDDAHAMVLCSLAASFESYVFPLEVDLEIELVKLPTSKPARQEFTAEVVISQGGAEAVRVSASYQVVRARSLARQEGALAAKAIRAQVGSPTLVASPVEVPRVCSAAARTPARVPLSS